LGLPLNPRNGECDWLTAKLLLALASTAIMGSESHGAHDHILLSDGSGSLRIFGECGRDWLLFIYIYI
jgi:hypothetical protein